MVTRGENVQVIAQGMANSSYYFWIENSLDGSGKPGKQPPVINPGQGIRMDDEKGPYEIGKYQYMGGAGRSLKQGVPDEPLHGARYYCRFDTDENGKRILNLNISPDTGSFLYQVRVERKYATEYDSDIAYLYVAEGKSDLTRGSVLLEQVHPELPEITNSTKPISIQTGKDTYAFGERVLAGGKNLVSDDTYLALFGPNLGKPGRLPINPMVPCDPADPFTYGYASVTRDGEWKFPWYTDGLSLASGNYSLRVFPQPGTGEYAETNITFIERGMNLQAVPDNLTLIISGETDPARTGISIWFIGDNVAEYDNFNLLLDRYATYRYGLSDLSPGDYYLIVQHPGRNGMFEIYPENPMTPEKVLRGRYPDEETVCTISGPEGLLKKAASEALISEPQTILPIGHNLST
jgi:hypothetical protein